MTIVPTFSLRGASARKAMPANIEAEQALLGAILYDNRALSLLDDATAPEHFHEPFHGRLFAAMLDGWRRGVLVEPIMLATRFDGDPAFADLGGLRYFAELVDHAPPHVNAPDFARLIADLAVRRDLVRLSQALDRAVDDAERSSDLLIADAESTLIEIAKGGGLQSAWQDGEALADSIDEVLNRQAGLPGVPLLLPAVDRILNGLIPGKMIVVGGRPAMGKSAVAVKIMEAMGEQGKGCGIFSLEMEAWEIGLRMACGVAFDMSAPQAFGRSNNPNYFAAARGEVVEEAKYRLLDAREKVRSWKKLLSIDTRSGLQPSQIVPAAKRLVRRWERDGVEPGCLIVDHLHIVKPDQDRGGNRGAEIGDVSGALRDLAKETGVPLVAMCQLNRQVESRDVKDKRPTLADLRWSGEIEQDAYAVVFLHRPEYYLRQPDDPTDFSAETAYREKLARVRHKLEWIVAKNRGGPTGQATTFCDIACNAIRDIGEQYDEGFR